MYLQLQEILNKCIEKGRNYKRVSDYLYCTPTGLWNNDGSSCYYNELISYHDLFSKDSGLMEFIEWRATMSFGDGNLKVRYNEMSTMTAEEKVKYFIDNVVM